MAFMQDLFKDRLLWLILSEGRSKGGTKCSECGHKWNAPEVGLVPEPGPCSWSRSRCGSRCRCRSRNRRRNRSRSRARRKWKQSRSQVQDPDPSLQPGLLHIPARFCLELLLKHGRGSRSPALSGNQRPHRGLIAPHPHVRGNPFTASPHPGPVWGHSEEAHGPNPRLPGDARVEPGL